MPLPPRVVRERDEPMRSRLVRREPGRARRLWATLEPHERRSLLTMGAVILALHAIGIAVLLALVAPAHAAGAGSLTVGVGLTAYTLGLRHAFDADHISAIDNTTRKLMQEG